MVWFSLAGYSFLIFFLSSSSHPVPFFEVIQEYHSDWILHGVEYALFGFLCARALNVFFRYRWIPALVFFVFCAGVLYGAFDEWHQSFVPGRDPSLYDGLADAAGVLAGAWFWLRRNRKRVEARCRR
ncbi:MAG: VanZ family protein [Candidatus Omnitrophica bacterium]|nr:VanZ family protein [Candidatus Omnitrophota bacterium]